MKICNNHYRNFYTLSEAQNVDLQSKKCFIIANEKRKKNGNTGRYFTTFRDFQTFIDLRDHFCHSNEILADHSEKKSDPSGRLVFDFDIKKENEMVLPPDFFKQVKKVVNIVIERYFKNVNTKLFQFVWSSSDNPSKYSFHLTVKNLLFDDWIYLSKIFYDLFSNEWEYQYQWISSNKLIDKQIIRKNGSLRMVGSSKINGSKLLFLKNKYSLEDSLIRIYRKKDREKEQKVSIDQLMMSSIESILQKEKLFVYSHVKGGKSSVCSENPTYPIKIYQRAYNLYQKIDPGIFKMGKIGGKNISLQRKRKHPCLLSGINHEHENSYCYIVDKEKYFDVWFGCYRKCYHKNTIYLGKIYPNSNKLSSYKGAVKRRNIFCKISYEL